MQRYQYQKKEPQYSEFQRFMQYSLDAPSRQMNFMPLTYPGVPLYYQLNTEQFHRLRHNEHTIEIQDLIAENTKQHQDDNFLRQFPVANQKPLNKAYVPQRASVGQQIVSFNISKMPEFNDPTMKSFLGPEFSKIARPADNNSSINVEGNLLQQINLRDQVDQAYKKLLQ